MTDPDENSKNHPGHSTALCHSEIQCDQNFATYKQELIAECNTAAQGVEFVSLGSGEDDDYYDQIHDFVGDLIKEENFYRTEGVQARGLIWNLLAIAYSEGEYSASEKRLIRYITKKCGVDYAILLEMEHTFNTLLAIEKEEEWLKSSDRPYKVIEERVKELQNRKYAIMQGVNALIMD